MIKLYVGNLPYSYTEESIRNLFTGFGELASVTLIIDRATGRSKGFAFVELDDEQGQNAVRDLNGKDIEGRNIVVNEARPMTERPKRDFGGGGRPGGFKKRY